ncbi:hypothetical protein ATY75_12085 [Rhizobium sp. N122]|nr:hypothetical protein ATY75_12085 [Rhizobium sp. N122]
MSAVNVFNPTEADIAAREMIERTSRGYGDQMNAYDKVADLCSLSGRQLRRFLSGDLKDPSFRLLSGIQGGWIKFWKAEVGRLQTVVADYEERYGSDHLIDIKAEAEALAKRLEIAEKQTKGR